MNLDNRIKAFVELGKFLKQFENGAEKLPDNALNELFYNDFEELIHRSKIHNPWFTEQNVRSAIGALANALTESQLLDWVSHYVSNLNTTVASKKVAVIMAGNVPLVGFNDFLCVLISGNTFIGKLSSEDKLLLPFIAKIVIHIEPEFSSYISFTEGQLKSMDAVIATGSNNSARYFEYYFGKYPHIIRKNRNSVAVLNGAETTNDLKELAHDIFKYFGLGCRNVSKLFVPKNYSFDVFYESIFDYQHVVSNNKYANNYEYNRTIYLMNSNPTLLDNNFLLLKQDASYSSPIGVLFYEHYENINDLSKRLEADKEQIQCVVSGIKELKNALPFGLAQCPTLMDYADGIDTMKFLIDLK